MVESESIPESIRYVQNGSKSNMINFMFQKFKTDTDRFQVLGWEPKKMKPAHPYL